MTFYRARGVGVEDWRCQGYNVGGVAGGGLTKKFRAFACFFAIILRHSSIAAGTLRSRGISIGRTRFASDFLIRRAASL
jgi:hypothetical protein